MFENDQDFFRFGNAKFIYLNEYKSYISHCYKIMASECKKWLDMREWPLQNTGFAMWSTCLSVLIPLHITVNIPLILSLRSHWNYESNKRSYTSMNFCEMLQITLMYENICLANTLIKSQCDAYIYIYIYICIYHVSHYNDIVTRYQHYAAKWYIQMTKFSKII